MCKFFSLVSNGDGKPLYFDAKLRKECREGKLNYNPDSHTSIADYYGFKGALEDKLNKYEYNPITKVFEVDQRNNPKDDSLDIKRFCEKLYFKLIVPELNIHPIVHPFQDLKTTKVTKKELELLKQWASVGASVWDSVGASVRDIVWDIVWDSVRDIVWDSVGASVRDIVWDSVGASVWDSVGASVRAYTSSFFTLDKWKHIDHKKGVNPFQPCIDLWNRGLVPCTDGKIWYLCGKGGKIVWKGRIK